MTTILFAFGMIFLVPQLFLIGLWTMGNATGCGLILADSNGGEILREAPEHRMARGYPPGGAHAFCARGGASAASLERSRGARGGGQARSCSALHFSIFGNLSL
jgi:hypothetical protein